MDGNHDVPEWELDPDDEELVNARVESVMSSVRDKPQMPSRRSSDRPAVHRPIPGQTSFTRLTKRNKQVLKLSISNEKNKITWSTSSNDSKKLDKRKQIYVDDIRDIRAGDAAAINLGEITIPESSIPLLITIVYYEEKPKHLHLLAPSPQQREVWREALWEVWHDRGDVMVGMVEQDERTLREHWRRTMGLKYAADSQADEGFDFEMIKNACFSYHIHKPVKQMKEVFDITDVDRTGMLNLKQYLEFFRRLTESANVKGVFEALTKDTAGSLTLDTFMAFLRNHQGVKVDKEFSHWEKVFNRYKDSPSTGIHSDDHTMSFEAFRNFLSSKSNSALIQQAKQPLDRPICDYFISSSHNTYLLGRQINGSSSVEAYIIALKRGCRCIEIDCWDGDGGKPIVTHGRTLSSSVSFSDCIKAVGQYAFESSEYPVIISLEVHCNAAQQAVMAEIMKTYLAPYLLHEALPTHRNMLPSPEDLKKKILIKVKRPRQDNGGSSSSMQKPVGHRRGRSASAPVPPVAAKDRGGLSSLSTPEQSTPSTPMPRHAATFGSEPLITEHSTSDDEASENEEFTIPAKKQATSKIVPVLGKMGIYTQGTPFSDWKSRDSRLFSHIYSFNEKTFEKRSSTAELKAALQRHNAHFLMRVYPHGTRVRSDNFDPIQFWRRGVQMVATNWQTRDIGTEINDAMFASDCDKRGYVLKPTELEVYKQISSSRQDCKLPVKQVEFSIRIIAGQHLGNDSGHAPQNPYVVLEVYTANDKARRKAQGTGGAEDSHKDGIAGLGRPMKYFTLIVPGNGYDPVWDQSCSVNFETKYPGLIFVRWSVRHSTDGRTANGKDIVSAYTAKLSSLAEGFRYIPLYNRNGEPVHSKLFCYIKKQEHVDIAEPSVPERPVIEEGGQRKRDRVVGMFRTISNRRTKAETIAGAVSPLISSSYR